MTELSFDRSNGAIEVTGKVAGKKTKVIVDTGSPWELLVSYSQALENGWITGSEPQYDPRIVDRRAVRVTKEIEFSVKNVKLVFREVVAWDLDGFGGGTNPIVGLKFLNKFQTEFDFENSKLRLHKLNCKPDFPTRNIRAIWLHPVREDALLMRGGVKDSFGWFLWDTGAEMSSIFRPALEQIKAPWAKEVKWGEPKEHTLAGHSRATSDFMVPEFFFCGFRPGSKTPTVSYENESFWSNDFPLHQAGLESSFGLPLMGLINADVFGAKRLLVDPKHSCLWTAQ